MSQWWWPMTSPSSSCVKRRETRAETTVCRKNAQHFALMLAVMAGFSLVGTSAKAAPSGTETVTVNLNFGKFAPPLPGASSGTISVSPTGVITTSGGVVSFWNLTANKGTNAPRGCTITIKPGKGTISATGASISGMLISGTSSMTVTGGTFLPAGTRNFPTGTNKTLTFRCGATMTVAAGQTASNNYTGTLTVTFTYA